jgi:hypothetical protein
MRFTLRHFSTQGFYLVRDYRYSNTVGSKNASSCRRVSPDGCALADIEVQEVSTDATDGRRVEISVNVVEIGSKPTPKSRSIAAICGPTGGASTDGGGD